MSNKKTIIVLLGGDEANMRLRAKKAITYIEEQFDVVIVATGFPSEVAFLKHQLDGYECLFFSRDKAYDTLTNWFDVRQLFLDEEDLFKLLGPTALTLIVPTSPSHYWRFQKILKMLQWWSKKYKVFRLKQELSGEESGKYEWVMNFFYRLDSLGIVGLSFLAYVARIRKK